MPRHERVDLGPVPDQCFEGEGLPPGDPVNGNRRGDHQRERQQAAEKAGTGAGSA